MASRFVCVQAEDDMTSCCYNFLFTCKSLSRPSSDSLSLSLSLSLRGWWTKRAPSRSACWTCAATTTGSRRPPSSTASWFWRSSRRWSWCRRSLTVTSSPRPDLASTSSRKRSLAFGLFVKFTKALFIYLFDFIDFVLGTMWVLLCLLVMYMYVGLKYLKVEQWWGGGGGKTTEYHGWIRERIATPNMDDFNFILIYHYRFYLVNQKDSNLPLLHEEDLICSVVTYTDISPKGACTLSSFCSSTIKQLVK